MMMQAASAISFLPMFVLNILKTKCFLGIVKESAIFYDCTVHVLQCLLVSMLPQNDKFKNL